MKQFNLSLFLNVQDLTGLLRDMLTKIALERLNIITLLFGSERYSYEYNILIQETVQNFVLGSARFIN